MAFPTIRTVQLSDTHFLEVGEEPEGGFAYDTSAAFDAVFETLRGDQTDLVVVTGDVADHGRAAQYARAAAAFERFDAPVNVCPGNHDQDAVFEARMGRTRVSTSRVIETGAWCFLFVDSSAGVMVEHESGRMVDPPVYEDRLHCNGALGEREAAWIRDMCTTTEAEHVFVWLHHPPPGLVGLTANDDYAAEWKALLADLPMVRGFGGGHTHVPNEYRFEGRPVFVCPSLKNNFDLAEQTLLPPGSRTYEFASDGSITSDVQLTDDPRWPRHRMPRSVVALLNGELSHDEFAAIVARRQAANAG